MIVEPFNRNRWGGGSYRALLGGRGRVGGEYADIDGIMKRM